MPHLARGIVAAHKALGNSTGGSMDEIGRGVASLRLWSQVARWAIGIFLVLLALLIVLHIGLLAEELGGGFYGGFYTYSRALAVVLIGSNVLLGLFFAAAAVPIVGWIYRAHANLTRAGVSELTYTPVWAVGSFFVPLVNLVVPFRAMRELHNRSHGEGPWQAHSPVSDVTSWWSCLIAAAVVSTVAGLVALLATIPNLYVVQPPGVNTALVLFSLVLEAGSGFFLFRTIGAVTAAQRQMMHLGHAEVFA